jgi:hypothetical protein
MSKNLLFALLFICAGLVASAQETNSLKTPRFTPFIEASYGMGLCGESNPLAFTGGVRQSLSRKLSLVYDINVWSTPYEVYCGDIYSKGKYTAITPSVKLLYYLGKREGHGFFIGAGVGYIFAKDRGTEQPYTFDGSSEPVIGKDITKGKWDFNSIAPSLTFGYQFSICKLPVSIVSTTYIAKTTCGWQAVQSGIGLNIGLKKRK